jgi:hypothetical protein
LITEESSLIDVAFAVCTALEHGDIRAVLTGGSAATYWAPDVYQSRDADFVLNFGTDQRSLVEIMRNLGFRSNGGTWIHERSQFTVEFPPGPLAIGNDLVTRCERIDRSDGSILEVLTPEDSVRDRLAHFIHWSDRAALRAAVGVAANHLGAIDLGAIRDWASRESRQGNQHFSEFERGVRGRGFERGIGW